MKKRILGNSGLAVSPIGLGCWGMSGSYGKSDRNESILTIHKGIDSGINFLDTADVYGSGHNELLVGEALKGRRHDVILATKFGFIEDREGSMAVCGRPDYVKQACEASLKRLNTDYIDLYYLHRLDKGVPIEETVHAMAQLVAEGKVRYIGLSEVSAKTLYNANRVHQITALQSEYSLTTRDIESEILPACRDLGTALVAFSPLGRALLTGTIKSVDDFEQEDFRRDLPRFRGRNFERNIKTLPIIERIAESKGAKPSQIAIAWLLHKGEDVIPIPGMKTRKYITENIAAENVALTQSDMDELDRVHDNIIGDRYDEEILQFIDR